MGHDVRRKMLAPSPELILNQTEERNRLSNTPRGHDLPRGHSNVQQTGAGREARNPIAVTVQEVSMRITASRSRNPCLTTTMSKKWSMWISHRCYYLLYPADDER